MKAALQEADGTEDEAGGSESLRMKDARGRDILSPEEKARKGEGARKISAAEVRHIQDFIRSFTYSKM